MTMKKYSFNQSLSLALAALISCSAVPVSADSSTVLTLTPSDVIPGRGVFGDVIPAYDNDVSYADHEQVRVSVVLEDDCTIEAGFSTDGISGDRDAVTYREALLAKQEEIAEVISSEALDGEALDVVWNLTLAANIISANVEYGSVEDILAVDGVKDVVIETVYYPCVIDREEENDPNMATSAAMTGTSAAWAEGYTGAGQRIAVIDTGTDTDHQSFDEGAFEYALAQSDDDCDLLDADEIALVMDQLNITSSYRGDADGLYISAKLPFGYNYIDQSTNITHDEDPQGSHGSHVAGIAAANRYIPDGDGYTDAIDAVSMQGAAPDAQILTMKVFGKKGGAYDSDYMAAIEDAIILGADAVNLSLGTAVAGSSRSSAATYQAILDSLTLTDTVVTVSGGNAYSWATTASPLYDSYGWGYPYGDSGNFSTASAPGTYTNTLAVASADNDGTTGQYIRCGDDLIFYTEKLYSNKSVTTLAGDHEFVFLPDAGNEEADFAAIADVLRGRIAVVHRGVTAFSEKANAAVQNGAIGVIIANNTSGILNMDLTGYRYTAPVVSITQTDGSVLLSNAETVTDGDGNVLYYTGSLTISESIGHTAYGSEYYTMSAFSSWGVPGSLEMKPEITAPGGSIYSVDGMDKSGTAYEVMSGTSMAAPQTAAMTAVLAQYIRENALDEKTGLSVRQLSQSLLMSTAKALTDPNTDYGTPYSILKQGAGLANVGDAVSAKVFLLMDEGTNAGASDGKIKAELGDDPDYSGLYEYGFTVTNLTDEPLTYTLSGDYFTQDFFAYYANNAGDIGIFMDELTYPLLMHTTYAADGREIIPDPGIFRHDFNGDGSIDENDGQALLDYAAGVRTELNDMDYADLNGVGRIDSYDAYLFFTSYEDAAVTVPADGSVHITVTAEINRDYAGFLLAYLENGFYIEGYTTVRALTSTDGAIGETHSIPVLGYYGSWTDMPMFDVGTAVEYLSGDETRNPYLYSARGTNSYYANALTVEYADEPGESYVFGGNPLVPDSAYMPERNAFNNRNGDAFEKIHFTSIRPADAARVTMSADGELLEEHDLGYIAPAYYNHTRSTWMNTVQSVLFEPDSVDSLADGDAFELSLTLAPEYYIDTDGTVRWDELGDGATLTFPAVIDTIAPTAEEPILDRDAMTLTVTAQDNRYVAAVVLYNSTGTDVLTYTGAVQDIDAGEAAEYTLDLSGVSGTSFTLTVYDYAMNGTSYTVAAVLGDPDPAESVTVTPETMTLITGNTAALTAQVLPETADPGVQWTSSDETVASVDKYGNVTAVSEGSAVITACAASDTAVSDTCTVTVETVHADAHGVYQDADGNPMYFDWDLASGTIKNGSALDFQITAAAESGMDGVNYIVSDSYVINAVNESGAVLASYESDGYPIWDMTASGSYTDDGETPLIHGLYWSYVNPCADVTAYSLTTSANLLDFSGLLSQYTGASYLTGIAAYEYIELPVGESETISGEGIYLLDSSGAVWLALIHDNGSMTVLNYYESDLTDCGAQFTGYGSDDLFCSMVLGDDGCLYLSEFNGDTSVLYRLSYNPDAQAFDAAVVGDVGTDVWPAALLSVTSDTSEADFAQIAGTADPAGFTALTPTESASRRSLREPAFSGTTNALTDSVTRPDIPVLPLSGVIISDDETSLTVEVTAKDAADSEIFSTNGVNTVTYDPSVLTLESVTVHGDCISVLREDGSVTFGYVSMDGIDAGVPVATLRFTVNSTDSPEMTVLHREVNDQAIAYTETLEIDYEHALTQRIHYRMATLTRDGYTGDIICAHCGKVLRKGTVIPAVSGPAMGTTLPMTGIEISASSGAVSGWAEIMKEIIAARKLRDQRMAAEKAESLPCCEQDDCRCEQCTCDGQRCDLP